MIVVGKIHRTSYVNLFMEGDVTMFTEGGVKRMKAPQVIVSPANTKRFSFSHEDMRWVTVHPNPTNNTDISELEAEIHLEKYDDFVDVVKDIDIDGIFDDFIRSIKGDTRRALCQE